MRFGASSLSFALLALAAAGPLPAAAQDSDPSEPLTYEQSVRCSTIYTLLAGSMDEGSAEAAGLQETAERWLLMATARDGTEDGSKSLTDYKAALDALIAKVNSMENDDAGITSFLEGHLATCEGLQGENSVEFDTVQ
ncbi:MAG: hypothetical protein AAF127_03920 [Pseudomonadota bacterium]